MTSRRRACWPAVVLGMTAMACHPAPLSAPELSIARETQSSGTGALLQAVSAVSDSVVWVSGHRGTWARTLDGGRTWQTGSVPGGDSLQFRDVHAASADTAWLMSAGPGEQSRIYRTTDGGGTWTQQFRNTQPSAFYDCLDFWDARHGLAFSDAVEGRTMVLETTDGEHWALIDRARLPAALPGEGGFAASGTCLITRKGGDAWIGTGNGPTARVLRTRDYGRTWTVSEVPIAAGAAAGIATVAFRDSRHGAALGGPIGKPDAVTDNVAITDDGGVTWDSGGRPTFVGAVYGAAFVPGSANTIVAVGPKGASVSRDGGRQWAAIDSLNYWGLGFSPAGAGWLVGPQGRITHLRLK